jgi:hypothetical protein
MAQCTVRPSRIVTTLTACGTKLDQVVPTGIVPAPRCTLRKENVMAMVIHNRRWLWRLLYHGLPEHSAWFPAGLIVDLEELLACEVDVVTQDALHWYIHDRVLEEAVPL